MTHHQDMVRKNRTLANSSKRRFWKYVNKNGSVHPICGQCWEWTGLLNQRGYGRINTGSLMINVAHRLSWLVHHGELSTDKLVLHKCDNRRCVNPDHLFLGTQKDNIDDMIDKCRQQDYLDVPKGEDHGMSKVTEEIVSEIRRRYTPKCPINGSSALGREFGLSRVHIERIAKGQAWEHLS